MHPFQSSVIAVHFLVNQYLSTINNCGYDVYSIKRPCCTLTTLVLCGYVVFAVPASRGQSHSSSSQLFQAGKLDYQYT